MSQSHGKRTAPGCGRGSRGPRRESENRTGHHRREPPGLTDRRSEGADAHECIAAKTAIIVRVHDVTGDEVVGHSCARTNQLGHRTSGRDEKKATAVSLWEETHEEERHDEDQSCSEGDRQGSLTQVGSERSTCVPERFGSR